MRTLTLNELADMVWSSTLLTLVFHLVLPQAGAR